MRIGEKMALGDKKVKSRRIKKLNKINKKKKTKKNWGGGGARMLKFNCNLFKYIMVLIIDAIIIKD